MTLSLRWHDDVPSDLAAVRRAFGAAVLEQARQLIVSLTADPLRGDWLEHHPTGDLSSCRKVKFGPDEVDDNGTNLGPALRLVYRLVPSNTEPPEIEVLAVAPRRNLEAYAIAAARLRDDT